MLTFFGSRTQEMSHMYIFPLYINMALKAEFLQTVADEALTCTFYFFHKFEKLFWNCTNRVDHYDLHNIYYWWPGLRILKFFNNIMVKTAQERILRDTLHKIIKFVYQTNADQKPIKSHLITPKSSNVRIGDYQIFDFLKKITKQNIAFKSRKFF